MDVVAKSKLIGRLAAKWAREKGAEPTEDPEFYEEVQRQIAETEKRERASD